MPNRSRASICVGLLAISLVACGSIASAASTRKVAPKAKAKAKATPHAAHPQAPRSGATPHPGATHRPPAGGHHVANRRGGGHGVSRSPYQNQNRNQNGAAGPMVASLRSVVAHLNQADHDYNGHRVQAIHQLDQAIGAMTRTSAGNGGGASVRAASHTRSNGPRMSQAESDAHLRQAHQQLTALEQHFGGQGTLPGHHQQAHSHVRAALGHLNTALATR